MGRGCAEATRAIVRERSEKESTGGSCNVPAQHLLQDQCHRWLRKQPESTGGDDCPCLAIDSLSTSSSRKCKTSGEAMQSPLLPCPCTPDSPQHGCHSRRGSDAHSCPKGRPSPASSYCLLSPAIAPESRRGPTPTLRRIDGRTTLSAASLALEP